MKKIASFITKKKIIIILLFLVAVVCSCFFIRKVKINYDISKYLNSESETSLALEITEEEFGLNGNMQVMIKNIDFNTSKQVQKDIKSIDYVLSVNYDPYNENYYKDNNALYILIIDGDDYSENAKSVIENVKELLSKYNTVYGGTAIDKQLLQESIESEMIYIIIVAISLAIAILLLTSESWIEPIILFGTAGIAIIINLGTNAFFSSISYITNSISAILQLALSIDYSIVLLHTYRKNKGAISNQEAMTKAIIQVVKPVSASGLTTLAGLCALLFMSYRIGFDIGIVLMKGIVISLITSITLLPGIILLFDNILEKTHKRSITFSGKLFSKIAKKSSKPIILMALVLIVICAIVNFNNEYVYSNETNIDQGISQTFGKNNQFMVVFKNNVSSYENQEAFIKEIKNYRTKNNKDVFLSYTSYTNTVLELYDQDKLVQKLEISKEEAELLLTMYNLYKDPDKEKMSFSEMISYCDYLLKNDKDAIDLVELNTKDVINKLIVIKDILESDNTSEELYNKLANEYLKELTNNVNKFSIEEIYGLYFFDTLEKKEVPFNDMLNFIIYAGENIEEFKQLINQGDLISLKYISNIINDNIIKAETKISKKELQGYMYQTYNKLLTDEEVEIIYNAYFINENKKIEESIEYLKLMNFMVDNGFITDNEAVMAIKENTEQYRIITSDYSFNEFIDVLKTIILSSTGLVIDIPFTNNDMYLVYVTYFINQQKFSNLKIKGSEFVSFVKDICENNAYMSNIIDKELYLNIIDLSLINDNLINIEKYNYLEMYDTLNKLKNSLHINLEMENINSDLVSGLYIKYNIYNSKNLSNPVIANNLLEFVNNNKYTNELLIKKLDKDNLEKIDEAIDKIKTANKLFKGGEYSRLLISMNLDMEGEDTETCVNYLKETSTKYFGNDSYIAGESVSTNDLKEAFKVDEIIISIVTIVSILLIIAVTFKSISLPIILVVVIQGACWIAFSTNAFTGSVFFMSYIIASCILMGATIDYGILMSSNYIENRKTMDKYESLEQAIKSSLPTIFTSGLILTICGFVICAISSQASISSVGLLVGKGTLASMMLILFLLPSLLYALDNIILKTTYKKK